MFARIGNCENPFRAIRAFRQPISDKGPAELRQLDHGGTPFGN
ncbi:hypothetical protein MGAST_12980 [Mycobacterium gastri 'Wayne']|nr:hypothetical protein MGAST_12980 [Mycobacterium gastri 'Wayne']